MKYKTAFYSFYLPVAMAMLMAGVKDPKKYDDALAILLEMGEFFQIQVTALPFSDALCTGRLLQMPGRQ